MPSDILQTRPTLVLVDIQREYIAPGRPFHLHGISPSLTNCRILLDRARLNNWPVVHVQHVQDGPVFTGEYARFIEGFEPKSGEPVFVKSQISPYTNEAFKQAMLAMRENEVVIAGYGSTMCCLSTIISGSALGLRHSFIHDASWARALGDTMPEADAHRHVTAIIENPWKDSNDRRSARHVIRNRSPKRKNPRFRGFFYCADRSQKSYIAPTRPAS